MATSESKNLKLTLEDNNEFIGIETTAENFRKIDEAFGGLDEKIKGANEKIFVTVTKNVSTVSANKTFAEVKEEIEKGNDVIVNFSSGTELTNARFSAVIVKDTAITFGGVAQSKLWAITSMASGWSVICTAPAQNGHGHENAEQDKPGFMSKTDKTKLDGIEAEANKTTVDSALSSTSENPVQNKVINSALSGKAPSSHTHSAATTSANGFLSSTDKKKLDGIATGANKVTIADAVTQNGSNPPKSSAIYNFVTTKINEAFFVDSGGTAS